MGNTDRPPIDVIARRELDIKDSSQKVVVELGRPYPRPGGEFACPFRITSGTTVIQREIFGLDAFQALQLALKIISADLHHAESLPIGKMYLVEPHNGLGFANPEVGK